MDKHFLPGPYDVIAVQKNKFNLVICSRNHDHIRHMSVTQTYLSRNSQALDIAERCGKTEVHVYSRFIYFLIVIVLLVLFLLHWFIFPLCPRYFNIRLSVRRFYNLLVYYYENLQIVCSVRLAQPAFFCPYSPTQPKIARGIQQA